MKDVDDLAPGVNDASVSHGDHGLKKEKGLHGLLEIQKLLDWRQIFDLGDLGDCSAEGSGGYKLRKDFGSHIRRQERRIAGHTVHKEWHIDPPNLRLLHSPAGQWLAEAQGRLQGL
jgi:hypothetical protein